MTKLIFERFIFDEIMLNKRTCTWNGSEVDNGKWGVYQRKWDLDDLNESLDDYNEFTDINNLPPVVQRFHNLNPEYREIIIKKLPTREGTKCDDDISVDRYEIEFKD